MNLKATIVALLGALLCFPALAEGLSQQTFARRLSEKHQFDQATVLKLVSAPPVPEVLRLFNRPFTSVPWDKFEAKLIQERLIRNGITFWEENQEALQRAEHVYGVPASILVGLLGVETHYGSNVGNFRVLDALVTLGFHAKRRRQYFQTELEHFLIRARELNWDYTAVKGSYAGAIGIPQFMPSNIKRFAIDFDGDGQIDLVTNNADAIGSAANYLAEAGWKRGEPVAVPVKLQNRLGRTMVLRTLPGPEPRRWRVESNFNVIKRYNPSDSYAMAIFILSEKLKQRRAIVPLSEE